MPIEHFLQEAVALLGAAVLVALVSAPLRIPPVVGFLVTGLIIGPSGLGWVKDIERVEVFAEIGIVLLLFAIGLELSIGELRELGRPFLVAGAVQCALTAAVAGAGAALLGEPARAAIFVGLVVSLSSTAVVLKIYESRRELGTPQGKMSLAVLLFQDLLIVPIIVLVPVLAGVAAASASSLALRFGGAGAAIAAVFFLARTALPRVLHRVVALRSREVFVLGALAACLAMAWFTHTLGFSLALGAFLAGLMVSETEYSHQVVADIAPFRDLFSSIFFVSIGMLVDLPFALQHLPAIAAAAIAIVVMKAATATAAIRLAGYPIRIAIMAGMTLAQIGEFSFLIMAVGRSYGLLEGARFQLLLSASVLSLALTPSLFALAPTLGRRLVALGPRPVPEAPPAGGEPRAGHVVVVGYGMNGGLLVKVLREARIPFVVVELDPLTAREARGDGVPVLFGDATRREIQERAGMESARVAVFAISDSPAARLCVSLARILNPALHIIVRTRMVKEIEELRRCGADQVIAEEFESAIEIFTHVLELYHVPRNIVRAQTRLLRGEGYQMLRAERLGRGVSQAVIEALEAGTTDLFRVTGDGRLAGHTLRDLDLRSAGGSSVIAVVRGEQSFVNPSPELRLEAGDYLVLVGSHDQIERSFVYLDGEGGSERTA
ncbi:MAG TPA: cation:proton antiporter [Thermoanaerobaculia bacterium]|nr:cation:proton antiporter [Thermoanaerobaculia bacterium]